MKISKIKFISTLFYISYFLLLLNTLANKVNIISNYSGVISKISFGFLIISFSLSIIRLTKRQVFYNVVLLLLLCISYFISDNANFLILILLIVTAKNLRIYNIIKNDFYLRILIILFVLFSYFLGQTNDIYFYEHGIVRYSYGFAHPNLLGFQLVILYFEFCYIFGCKKKNLIFNFILLTFIVYLNNMYLGSRTCNYILIITFFVLIFYKAIVKYFESRRHLNILIRNLFLMIAIISFILTLMYNTELGSKLNRTLSNRLYYNSYTIDHYNISLFGQKMNFVSNEDARLNSGYSTYILDNSYFVIFYQFGLIGFFTFAVLTRKTFIDLFVEKKYFEIVIFAMILIDGFMESYMYKIVYNPFLFFMIYSVLGSGCNEKIEN